jgi:cytochrome c oxidase cbb3-type subunit I/II
VFSIMLIAPSWGGMVNGLLTLRGAWDRVREDPVLKFMVVGVTAYGMATFEGPMMSIKSVNALTHYTDYIIGHVHLGALAWNGGIAFAMLYYIVPRIYGTKLYSVRLANLHFWLATLGILFYVIPMYIGGITQSLMWRQFTPEGTLRYPNFLETVVRLAPMYALRVAGGSLFLLGALAAVYNLYRTAKNGALVRDERAQAAPLVPEPAHGTGHWHRSLESRPVRFAAATLVTVLVGGIVEFVPTALIKANVPTIAAVKPYTPLEVEGRDLYIREGCVGCHSQMIRPLRAETERYGEYSKAGEFVYDHPFLWGSKRTGPDLQREGGKYPDSWHFLHMRDPRSTSPGSIMPAYTWLYDAALDTSHTEGKIITLRRLGVPYPDGYERVATADLQRQARDIGTTLRQGGFQVRDEAEIIALIAYLQRLGTDIKAKTVVDATRATPILAEGVR